MNCGLVFASETKGEYDIFTSRSSHLKPLCNGLLHYFVVAYILLSCSWQVSDSLWVILRAGPLLQ